MQPLFLKKIIPTNNFNIVENSGSPQEALTRAIGLALKRNVEVCLPTLLSCYLASLETVCSHLANSSTPSKQLTTTSRLITFVTIVKKLHHNM